MRLNERAAASRFLVLVFPVCTFCAAQAHASTWTVATDGTGLFTSVQAGIDAAAAGDTIMVGPGTYAENIRFAGRDIVLTSVSGPEVTVLNGSGTALPVVQIRGGESNAAILSGFTITGGKGGYDIPGWTGGGGGVFVVDAEPTIINNIIANNTAVKMGAGFGGGVYCLGRNTSRQWQPVITHNVISKNRASGNGGGVGISYAMRPTISFNTVLNNATDDGDGGGLWIWVHAPSTPVEVSSNAIRRNSAGDHGGGLYIGSPTGVAVNVICKLNVVDNNSAYGLDLGESSGGGMWFGHCSGRVSNNTVVRNAGAEFLQGGGITIVSSPSIEIDHNIVAFTTVSGGIVCVNGGGDIHDNLAWMNGDGDGGGECQEWLLSGGNVRADPMFCDLAGDVFTVAQGSPALLHAGGAIGALSEPGCQGVAVQRLTWGLLKTRF